MKKLFRLWSEIDIFVIECGENIPQLSDNIWNLEFAFLVDITTYVRELSMTLKGKNKLLPGVFSGVKAL